MIDLVLNTSPKIGLEVIDFDPLPGNLHVRLYVADGSGVFPSRIAASMSLHINSSSDEDQLADILVYCGELVAPATAFDARAWLALMPQEEAVRRILKWLREVLAPSLTEFIRRFVTGGVTAPSGTPFVDPEALFKAVFGKYLVLTSDSAGAPVIEVRAP